MSFFKTTPVNDAAVAAISAMTESNLAEELMFSKFEAAAAAIAEFNASRTAFLSAHDAALAALQVNADTSEGAIGEHESDTAPDEIPDPTLPPRPPVAEAALDFSGAYRRSV